MAIAVHEFECRPESDPRDEFKRDPADLESVRFRMRRDTSYLNKLGEGHYHVHTRARATRMKVKFSKRR